MTPAQIRRRTAPPGAAFGWFEGADGTRLRCATWPAPAGAVRTVVLVHGRNEYIEKHFETVADLLDAGFAVASFDWRGQGLSQRPLPDRRKGHVADFALYVSDLHRFVTQVLPLALPRPVCLVGHSMGGHITLRTLAEHPDLAERAALSAPMLAARLGPGEVTQPALRLLTRILERIAPTSQAPGEGGFQEFRFDGNTLTTDPDRFADHEYFLTQQPDLALGWPTWGWLGAASRSSAFLMRAGTLARVTAPVLILSAPDEAVVLPALHRRAARLLPQGRILNFPGARHELLKERDATRDAVIAAIVAFFREGIAQAG